MRAALALLAILPLIGCATQRYGRETSLSEVEVQEFSCRDIRIETAKSDAFLKSIQAQRSRLNGAQVLGIFGDFGVGNGMEGNEAEASGRTRKRELRELALSKGCYDSVS
jgi:hypothetical protein